MMGHRGKVAFLLNQEFGFRRLYCVSYINLNTYRKVYRKKYGSGGQTIVVICAVRSRISTDFFEPAVLLDNPTGNCGLRNRSSPPL